MILYYGFTRRNGAKANGMKVNSLSQKLVDTDSLARGRNRVEKKQKQNKGMLQKKTDIMLEVQESVWRLFMDKMGRRYKGDFVSAG